MLGHNAIGVGESRSVGPRFVGPGAESRGQVVIQRSGKRKLGMDGCPSSRVGGGIVDVGVAAGSDSDGSVFFAVLRKYFSQCRRV